MGVAALHLESGRSAWLNADEAFPMASTYKVPIAVRLLSMVDDGELELDQRIDIGVEEYSPGSGMLAKLLDDPGLSVSLHNLLEIMLLISDNTATDRLLETVGGGDAVTAHMRSIGVEGMARGSFDHPPDRGLDRRQGHADGLRSPMGRLRGACRGAAGRRTGTGATGIRAGSSRYGNTTRNGFALLEKIWRGDALGAESGALLIDIMERCETGEARLKGLLPDGTVVAHKTGHDRPHNERCGRHYVAGQRRAYRRGCFRKGFEPRRTSA